MKYYIEGPNKNDFYHVGTYHSSMKVFEKGRGWEFIMAFLHDFPYLLNEITIINENDEEIMIDEFIENILNTYQHDFN